MAEEWLIETVVTGTRKHNSLCVLTVLNYVVYEVKSYKYYLVLNLLKTKELLKRRLINK